MPAEQRDEVYAAQAEEVRRRELRELADGASEELGPAELADLAARLIAPEQRF